MKIPAKTPATLFVAVVLSLGACGSPTSPAGSSDSGRPGASGSPASGAGASTASPGGSSAPTSDGSATATATPSRGAATSADPTYGGELNDFVSGSLNENVSWGCRFSAGDKCRVPIQGNYFIWSQIKGNVRFVAYKNDEKTPSFKSGALVATRGTTAMPYNVQLPYTVPTDATKVAFEVWLEDLNGKILARSKRNDVEVVT